MIPEYSKGISQPPKLTIFAPSRRWTEFRAVLRNSTAADVFTEGFSLSRRNIERSMRVLGCQGRRPLVIFIAAEDVGAHCIAAARLCVAGNRAVQGACGCVAHVLL